MFYTTVLFVSFLGFAYTSARPNSAHVVIKQIGFPHDTALLSTRQTDNIPSQCESTCASPLAAITNSCSPEQCCTATFETEYYNCFVCVGSAVNLTDYSSAQALLTEFEEECAAFGLGIPTLTLPGQGRSSSASPATSTRLVPASTTSARRPETNLSSSTSTGLPTLSVPPLPSTFIQRTVTIDTRTTTPTFTSTMPAEGSGVPTMGVQVSFVWAVILSFVIVAIGSI